MPAVFQSAPSAIAIHDVEVDRDRGTVEVRAPVSEDEIAAISVDQPETGVASGERGVVGCVERGGRDDGDGRRRKGWRDHECRVRERRRGQCRRMRPHGLISIHRVPLSLSLLLVSSLSPGVRRGGDSAGAHQSAGHVRPRRSAACSIAAMTATGGVPLVAVRKESGWSSRWWVSNGTEIPALHVFHSSRCRPVEVITAASGVRSCVTSVIAASGVATRIRRSVPAASRWQHGVTRRTRCRWLWPRRVPRRA